MSNNRALADLIAAGGTFGGNLTIQKADPRINFRKANGDWHGAIHGVDSVHRMEVAAFNPAGSASEKIRLEQAATTPLILPRFSGKILQHQDVFRGGSETTTSSTSYDGYSTAVSMAPLSSNSKCWVLAVAEAQAEGADDAGVNIQLTHYDGSNYVGKITLNPLTATSSGPTSLIQYYQVPLTYNFTQSDLRSDNGQWTIRVYYKCVYASQANATMRNVRYIMWEIED